MNDAGSLLHDSLSTKYPWKVVGKCAFHIVPHFMNPSTVALIEGRTCMHYEACSTEYSWDGTRHMTQGVSGLSIHYIIISAVSHMIHMIWLWHFNINIRYLLLLRRVVIICFKRSLRKLIHRIYTCVIVIWQIFFKTNASTPSSWRQKTPPTTRYHYPSLPLYPGERLPNLVFLVFLVSTSQDTRNSDSPWKPPRFSMLWYWHVDGTT